MFERLTADKVYLNSIRFGIQVNFPPHCGHKKAKEVDDFVKNVFDRLAAYEDIGLSPEEIADTIYRFEAFLSAMTGNRMSKSNYTLDAMISAANDYQQSLCDGCRDRSELNKADMVEEE